MAYVWRLPFFFVFFENGYPFRQVYNVLEGKGVQRLYHANSVATACQFLKCGSLMSRGSVERLGLRQTSQASDAIDRAYSLWYDVFMDSVDIHHRARTANIYGPVLFVIKLEAINHSSIGKLWVTKANPTKWQGKSKEERWFQDKLDLEENFVFGRFDQMIVARHCGGQLLIGDFLEKIILDEPDQITDDDVDLYSMAVGALRLAMQEGSIDVPIEKRKCRAGCDCKDYWDTKPTRLFKMFDPKK